MRTHNIDVKKSKEFDRLIRNNGLIDSILEVVINTFLVFSIPLFCVSLLIIALQKEDSLTLEVTLLLLSFVISALLLYSVNNIDRLKRIKGDAQYLNKEKIKELIKDQKWCLIGAHGQVAVIIPKSTDYSFTWGKEIIIIYDKQEVLVNVTSYGLHSIKSPFHWFSNRKLERLIIEKF